MEMTNRREFLSGLGWSALAMAAGGCATGGLGFGTGGNMNAFALKPFKRVRVGIVGLGARGGHALERLVAIPGVDVVAICDKKDALVDKWTKWLADNKWPAPRVYRGSEGWKALMDDTIDVAYIATPWALHAPMGLRAMRCGKIPLIEVPSAMTVDECWALVEASEKYRLPCMQLENCCYGEIEMLEFNIAKLGLLGELTHAEGAYIHDLRGLTNLRALNSGSGEAEWRYGENWAHKGDRYPTHGLVPLCLAFDINRGDKLDYLVSLESQQASWEVYKRHVLQPDDPRLRDGGVAMGDMNTTLIKTHNGRSLLIQHNVSSPRPYDRLQLIQGTKGCVGDYPFRVALEDKVGKGAHEWLDEKKLAEFRQKYMHPIWRKIGDTATKTGGHGGMDFIMDVRWAYCLQNALPLDMDVYDLATTCCLCELTETSVRNRSRSVDIPDFTRGAWRTNKPMDILDIDVSKLDFSKVREGIGMTI